MRVAFVDLAFSALRIICVITFVVIWDSFLVIVTGMARPTTIAFPFAPGFLVAPVILFLPVTFLTGIMPKALWIHPHRFRHRSEDVRRSGLWDFFSPAQGRAQPLKGLES